MAIRAPRGPPPHVLSFAHFPSKKGNFLFYKNPKKTHFLTYWLYFNALIIHPGGAPMGSRGPPRRGGLVASFFIRNVWFLLLRLLPFLLQILLLTHGPFIGCNAFLIIGSGGASPNANASNKGAPLPPLLRLRFRRAACGYLGAPRLQSIRGLSPLFFGAFRRPLTGQEGFLGGPRDCQGPPGGLLAEEILSPLPREVPPHIERPPYAQKRGRADGGPLGGPLELKEEDPEEEVMPKPLTEEEIYSGATRAACCF